MWLAYKSHFKSNHGFVICNLYWFKLARSATQTWNLGIGNYEHLIYYLDNENKKLPDCVQAIMVENEPLAHLRHCQDSSEVNTPALKPRYVPGIHGPLRAGYTKDLCKKQV